MDTGLTFLSSSFFASTAARNSTVPMIPMTLPTDFSSAKAGEGIRRQKAVRRRQKAEEKYFFSDRMYRIDWIVSFSSLWRVKK
jgi:hypothetical protein